MNICGGVLWVNLKRFHKVLVCLLKFLLIAQYLRGCNQQLNHESQEL